MLSAVASLTGLGLGLGLLLGIAARRFRVEANGMTAELEALMPGTQCGQCGFAGCGGAAAALIAGTAPVTLCPAGGRALAGALAAKLGIEVDLSGIEEAGPRIALIDEAICIGCVRCFKVCPTDAVVGAVKQIHGVLRDACTGCGKCVEVCPTASAQLAPLPATLQSWHWVKPAFAA